VCIAIRKIQTQHSTSVLNIKVESYWHGSTKLTNELLPGEVSKTRFHSPSKTSVWNNIGIADFAWRLEEVVKVLPILFSYGPKCSLKMDCKPERWDPGSNSVHVHPCKREQGN